MSEPRWKVQQGPFTRRWWVIPPRDRRKHFPTFAEAISYADKQARTTTNGETKS